MAFKVFIWVLFFCFPGSVSATHCDYDGQCYYHETCCKDSVCRETCDVCSYDFQCGTGECCGAKGICRTRCSDSLCECYGSLQSCCPDGVCRQKCNPDYCKYDAQCGTGECCNLYGDCKKSCDSYNSGAVIAGIIVSIVVFIAIVVFIVACFHCACCPYYRHRSRRRRAVHRSRRRRTVAAQLDPTAATQQNVQFQRPIPVIYDDPPPYPGAPVIRINPAPSSLRLQQPAIHKESSSQT